ncbi:hypothetical protein KCP74_20170 [Salmonella enterica subsp. enterica]|nr:hypothetical protein KCP74_20170 [Salmonella enterica subsp. enterica]
MAYEERLENSAALPEQSGAASNHCKRARDMAGSDEYRQAEQALKAVSIAAG